MRYYTVKMFWCVIVFLMAVVVCHLLFSSAADAADKPKKPDFAKYSTMKLFNYCTKKHQGIDPMLLATKVPNELKCFIPQWPAAEKIYQDRINNGATPFMALAEITKYMTITYENNADAKDKKLHDKTHHKPRRRRGK